MRSCGFAFLPGVHLLTPVQTCSRTGEDIDLGNEDDRDSIQLNTRRHKLYVQFSHFLQCTHRPILKVKETPELLSITELCLHLFIGVRT